MNFKLYDQDEDLEIKEEVKEECLEITDVVVVKSCDYIRLLNMTLESENITSEDHNICESKLYKNDFQKCFLTDKENYSMFSVSEQELSLGLYFPGNDGNCQLEFTKQSEMNNSLDEDIEMQEDGIDAVSGGVSVEEELNVYVKLLNKEKMENKLILYHKKLCSNNNSTFKDVGSKNVKKLIELEYEENFLIEKKNKDTASVVKQVDSFTKDMDGDKRPLRKKNSDFVSKKPQENGLREQSKGKIKETNEEINEQTKEKIIKQKIRTRAKRRRFTCAECGKTVGKKWRLLQHLRSVHEMSESHKCLVCKRTFTSQMSLTGHMLSSHANSPHKCSTCGSVFTQKYSLAKHIKLVHEKLELSQCPKCELRFTTKSSLSRHFQSIHEKMRHKCSVCGMTFSIIHSLRLHIRNVHDKESAYKCSSCDRVFGLRICLTRHIRTVHKKLKLFNCNECDRNFSRKDKLLLHIRSIHEQICYECSECGKTFNRKDSLNAHLRVYHEKGRHICSKCGKSFSSKHCLSIHFQSEHAQLRHKCSECEKSFCWKGSLTKHFRLHHAKTKKFTK